MSWTAGRRLACSRLRDGRLRGGLSSSRGGCRTGPPNIPLELICHGGSFSVIFGGHFGGRFRFFACKLAQKRSFSVVSGI